MRSRKATFFSKRIKRLFWTARGKLCFTVLISWRAKVASSVAKARRICLIYHCFNSFNPSRATASSLDCKSISLYVVASWAAFSGFFSRPSFNKVILSFLGVFIAACVSELLLLSWAVSFPSIKLFCAFCAAASLFFSAAISAAAFACLSFSFSIQYWLYDCGNRLGNISAIFGKAV